MPTDTKEMDEKELYKLYRSWSAPKQGRAIRTIKMVKPHCKECQWPPRDEWWVNCPHDPYVNQSTFEVTEPVFGEDEKGDTIVEKMVTKMKVKRTPNFTQVALNERINSGQGVKLAQKKGFKFSTELGHPPFCQYRDCWEPDPKLRTEHGDFCSKQQARLIAADANNLILEVYLPRKRRQQLESINIG